MKRSGGGGGGAARAGAWGARRRGGLCAVCRRCGVPRVSGRTPCKTAIGGVAESRGRGTRIGGVWNAHRFHRGFSECRSRTLRLVRRKRGGVESHCATARRSETAQDCSRRKTFPTARGAGRQNPPPDTDLFLPSAAHGGASQLR